MRSDSTTGDIARKVGMGRRPEQFQTETAHGVGRGIGRRPPGSIGSKVD